MKGNSVFRMHLVFCSSCGYIVLGETKLIMMKTELQNLLATRESARNAVHSAGAGGEGTLHLPLPIPQQLGFKMLRPYITD